MSISSSFSNALSGMTAAAQRAQVVSSNIANALTDGYGRRSVEIAAQHNGGGVRVLGIARESDTVLTGDRRAAEAGLGEATVRSDGLARIERAIGTPDSPGSLTDLVNRFETALIDAGSRPDAETRLDALGRAAGQLADGISDAARTVQEVRTGAERAITNAVDTLNTSLEQVDRLNRNISRSMARGVDTSALMDQRQIVIDRISDLVPVRELERPGGQVALMTPSGTTLLDGTVKSFAFTPAQVITPFQTIEAGTLGALEFDGEPISVENRVGGGRLAGAFAVRDTIAPQAQSALDGFARDLIERFADPALDTTRAPGDPGLFTDAGAAFDPADETGLAQRIALNPAVDPAAGGAVTRLRDGLGAAATGPVGEAGLLNAMAAALTAARTPGSANLPSTEHTLGGLAADIVSGISMTRQFTNDTRAEMAARTETLRTLERENGVDTDAELQDLLLIEQAYAANARVIQAVDEMISRVLEI